MQHKSSMHGNGCPSGSSHTITAMEEKILYLKSETKRLLEKSIGKSITELSRMDAKEEEAYVAQKIGKPLTYSKKADSRMRARGNSLIARRRFCTMEDVDKRIMELK